MDLAARDELVRETILSLSAPNADSAVAVAREAVAREALLTDEASRQLEAAGWTVEHQPPLEGARPDLLARKDSRVVIAEVKARRQSLTNGLSSQLSLIKEATEAAYPEAKVQPLF